MIEKPFFFLNRPGAIIRHYHGYIFSWAVIYTFWYHPMEATFGHLVGFLYALFVAGVIFSYADRPIDVNEVIRIPVIEYGLVFILALFIYLGIWVNKGVKRLHRVNA